MEASKFSGLACVDARSVQEPQHHSFLLISTDQFVALLGKELLLGSKSSRMVKLNEIIHVHKGNQGPKNPLVQTL